MPRDRMGVGEGLEGLSRVQRRLLRKLLREEARNEYTLDIDATQIVAEKERAKWTYKGEKGICRWWVCWLDS